MTDIQTGQHAQLVHEQTGWTPQHAPEVIGAGEIVEVVDRRVIELLGGRVFYRVRWGTLTTWLDAIELTACDGQEAT